MADIDSLKTKFLRKIQSNQFEEAKEVGQAIIELDPEDMIVQRFQSFITKHSEASHNINPQDIFTPTMNVESDDDTTQEDFNKETSESSDLSQNPPKLNRQREDSLLQQPRLNKQSRSTFCVSNRAPDHP